ncbi:MAG: hypothetical protein WB998_10710, partial [Solirubrobacteraceae bacterium]
MRPPRAASLTQRLVLGLVLACFASPCVAIAARIDNPGALTSVSQRHEVGAPRPSASGLLEAPVPGPPDPSKEGSGDGGQHGSPHAASPPAIAPSG